MQAGPHGRLAGWREVSALSGCRYDHFSVLCELLPVGIPSLAVCLQSLLHGTVTAPPRRMGRGQQVWRQASSGLDQSALVVREGVPHPVSHPPLLPAQASKPKPKTGGEGKAHLHVDLPPETMNP